MTVGEWLDTAAKIATIAGILVTVWINLHNRTNIRATQAEVRELKISVNGRLEQLLSFSKIANTAIGNAEGRAEEVAAQVVRDAKVRDA